MIEDKPENIMLTFSTVQGKEFQMTLKEAFRKKKENIPLYISFKEHEVKKNIKISTSNEK